MHRVVLYSTVSVHMSYLIALGFFNSSVCLYEFIYIVNQSLFLSFIVFHNGSFGLIVFYFILFGRLQIEYDFICYVYI